MPKIIIMKKLFIIFLLSGIYLSGNAQSHGRRAANSADATVPGRFSIGLEGGIPVGGNTKPYSHTLGGSLQYEALPASDVGITLSAGYLNSIKSAYGSGSIGFVPLLAGVKYYFVPGIFFHAQLGAAIGTSHGQGTSFAYSPGLGFRLSHNFDAEVKYMGISNKGGNLDNVGLRIGYNF